MKPTPLLCRRAFLTAGVGLGATALHWLLHRGRRSQPITSTDASEDVPPGAVMSPDAHMPHFPAKALSVIYLFMAGGPVSSTFFESSRSTRCRPARRPASLLRGQRFAFMDLFAGERPSLARPDHRHPAWLERRGRRMRRRTWAASPINSPSFMAYRPMRSITRGDVAGEYRFNCRPTEHGPG